MIIEGIMKKENEEPKSIFSGEDSRNMWRDLAAADTVNKLKNVIYTVCCRLQLLEAKLYEKK